MIKQIRKAMRYVSCLPQLKARNKVYLKLKQIESNYKNKRENKYNIVNNQL